MAPNSGFARRVLDYVSYAVCAVLAALRMDFDVVIATSPQFFTAVAGRVIGGIKNRPWVFELRDLWPESIVATGSMRRSLVIEALERIELGLYRAATMIVPVTESFRETLIGHGYPARSDPSGDQWCRS